MEHIKNLLGKRLKQSGLAKDVNTSLIIEEFAKIIKEIWGDNIIRKIKPLYLKDRKLHVACLNSVIIQEITLKKEEIISKINQKFNNDVLSDIRFMI